MADTDSQRGITAAEAGWCGLTAVVSDAVESDTGCGADAAGSDVAEGNGMVCGAVSACGIWLVAAVVAAGEVAVGMTVAVVRQFVECIKSFDGSDGKCVCGRDAAIDGGGIASGW